MEEVRRRMRSTRVEEEGSGGPSEETTAGEGGARGAEVDKDDEMKDAEGVPATELEEVGGEGVEKN
jgi:hypothetical protein